MTDTSFTRSLDPKKAALLNNFANIAQGKSMEDMLPLLLAVSNKAKREGIHFTADETNSIIDSFRHDMNPEQQSKLDLFMQMMRNA